MNQHALQQLTAEDQGNEAELFYKGLLSDLRHLLVFSEVAYEKLGVTLRRPNFDVEFRRKSAL